ncbi:Calx-beta domain-containing protein [Microvirga terricola]|uniref:Endonuclease n=1 Tax=Microvirga terricola TaxID=2719797 RepID=A0ABX0VD69_9HYPH|nr:endonuclease/exonuclease/phosphatase family protein [Microvirga terricola]NIX75792.1 endonuclease [Microvirga terricola]
MANVWINELHYDNAGADANEFIEIAGLAGTDLTGWKIQLYDGTTGNTYGTDIALSGVITNTSNGFGFVSVNAVGLQNGAPDGLALVNASGTVVEFLSYEGQFTAANGAASGMTSTNIVAVEDGSTGAAMGSIQRQGTGSSSSDFNTWTTFTSTSTRDGVNSGQTFITPSNDQSLSIVADNVSKVEGNNGVTIFTFTVTRANPSADVTVDWNLTGLGGAGHATADDFTGLTSGTLTFTGSETTKVIEIAVGADTVFEPNEIFSVTLSNASGGTSISTAAATSTILNDDPLAIYKIQGTGHTSEYVGQNVLTTGVITAIQMTGTTRGFYVQDVNGDGDATTSDAIFVFRGSTWTPNVEVGDAVTISGKVAEYKPSGSNDLTLTQFGTDAAVNVTSKGNALPDAVVIGPYGLMPPTGDVTSAAAFYESLEGMRVTIEPTRVVGATNAYGEIWTVIDGAYDPSSLNGRGGLASVGTDYNPERIQIDNIRDSLSMPMVDVGAKLGAVTGILSYGFSNYEVLVGTAPVVTQQSTLQPEVTKVTATNPFFLSFATYNVENLDPNDDDGDADIDSGHFAKVAQHIVKNMGAPAVISLQEIQDDSGSVDNGVVSADKTLQTLVDAIVGAGGPRYKFAYLNPENNKDGGQPGGNIRQAYLYNDDVVDLVPGSLARIVDPDPLVNDAFQSSRKPLIAQFTFNGETYTFINNHLNSKGGDDAIFGSNQPPVLASELQRIEQTKLIKAYVDQLLAADPNANIAVLGDLNDFTWSNPLKVLSGEAAGAQVLFELGDEFIADPNDRTDYIYNGNSQSLDHIYVSAAMLARIEAFDIVRVNSEFDAQQHASDHDPLVARALPFQIARGTDGNDHLVGDDASNALIGSAGNDLIQGHGGNDYLQGDDGNDTLDGGAGADALYGGAGIDTASYVSAATGVTVNLAAPGENTGNAADDTYDSLENLTGSAFNDILSGDAFDNVIDGGLGADLMKGGAGNDTYLVDNAGDRVIDAAGTDTIITTVSFSLSGSTGVEVLQAANNGAAIKLIGDSLANVLISNAGNNTLSGGLGADTLTGGAGKDSFVFDTKLSSSNIDKIVDFNVKDDTILLDNAIFKKLGAGTLSKPGALNKNFFTIGAKAKDKDDYIVYDATKGTLSYDADGSSAGKAVVFATISKGLKMTYADLLII